MLTITVQLNRRDGFVNSMFPSKADFLQKSNSTHDKKNKRKSLRNCQENYRETAPYLEQPGHHCLHLLKNNTSCTKNLFPWLGESTDENKALLFFTGWEAEFKVLAIPYNPLGHCLRKDFLTAIWFAMFENSVKIKLLHIPIFTHKLTRQNRQSNRT